MFENNRIAIKDIKINKYISLIIKTEFQNIEKESILFLNYGKKNKNIFLEKEKKMINEINNLKKEIKILKNEIEELKNYNNLIKEKLSMKKTSENKEKNLNNAYNNKPIFNIEKNSFSLDFNPTLSPKNIKFFNNLVYGSNGTYMSFNNYIVFKANNDITYLIYAYHLI